MNLWIAGAVVVLVVFAVVLIAKSANKKATDKKRDAALWGEDTKGKKGEHGKH